MSPQRLARWIPVALLAVSQALAALAPTASADALDEVLAEIDAVPDSAIAANPDGWAEVLALLEAYVAAMGAHGAVTATAAPATAPAVGAAGAHPGADADARIAQHFAALVAAHRQVPDIDPAAALFARGLRGQATAQRPAAPGPLGELASSLGPQAAPLGIEPLLALSRPTGTDLLMRRIETLGSSPHAAASQQGIREAFDQIRARAERHSHELLQVRDAGADTAQRLAGLASVVARGAALDGANASAASAQLASLRAELAALQSAQRASLARLAGPERFGGAGLVRDTQAPGLLR